MSCYVFCCVFNASQINQQGLEAIVFANRPIKKHGVLKFQFSKRVKFTMKKQKVKKLLQNLEDYNAKLDTFANKAEKLEEPYKAERKSKFVLPLSLVQGNAKKLYEGLSRSWCSAHSSHSAGLLLEPRLIIERQKRIQSHKQRHSVEQCDTHCFGISLLQNPSPKKWLDVEFRVVEDSSIGQRSMFVVPTDYPTSSCTKLPQKIYCSSSNIITSFEIVLQYALRRPVSASASDKSVRDHPTAHLSQHWLLHRRQWPFEGCIPCSTKGPHLCRERCQSRRPTHW
jgi:hypothetical protein